MDDAQFLVLLRDLDATHLVCRGGETTPYGRAADAIDRLTAERDREAMSARQAAHEAHTLRLEVERLRGWKYEAMTVLADWDRVWEALGRPGALGESAALASLAEVQILAAAPEGEPAGQDDDETPNAPSWVQSVTPAEIVRQRSLGWPDFHPEDFCHICGHRNPVWYAPAEDWDAVIDGHGGIFCPTCFATLHAAATGEAKGVWAFSRRDTRTAPEWEPAALAPPPGEPTDG